MLLSALRGRGWRRVAAWLPAIGALSIFLSPPLLLQIREGPSTLTGYAWSPQMWRRWQEVQEQSLARVDELMSRAAARPRSMVASGQWNDEFYVRMRLFEAGYRSIDTEQAYPGCSGFAVYRRGTSDVLHLRLWGQYRRSPFPQPETAALLMTTAIQCSAVRSLPEVELTTFGKTAAMYLNRPEFEESLFPLAAAVPAPASALELRLKSMLLGPQATVAHMPLFSLRSLSLADFITMAGRSKVLLETNAPLTRPRRIKMLGRYAAAFRPVAVGSLAWSGQTPEKSIRRTVAPNALPPATPTSKPSMTRRSWDTQHEGDAATREAGGACHVIGYTILGDGQAERRLEFRIAHGQ